MTKSIENAAIFDKKILIFATIPYQQLILRHSSLHPLPTSNGWSSTWTDAISKITASRLFTNTSTDVM